MFMPQKGLQMGRGPAKRVPISPERRKKRQKSHLPHHFRLEIFAADHH
jgi:hypothetical protein